MEIQAINPGTLKKFLRNKFNCCSTILFSNSRGQIMDELAAKDEWVIQTSGLSKTYKNIQALKGLSLKVPRHSIFGFLGPNGAGKTTTIKLLLGLARPSSGEGQVFGKDIVRENTEIRAKVGYLAQDPRYYEHMTARQTLTFTAGLFYSGPKDQIEERVQDMLNLVGLDDKADRPIKGFSGGERQRLGLAQAQVNYPDLLILDEPAASLDPQGRHDVLEVMERLRKYSTIFYSTHILDDVQRVSDRVAILNHGQLVAEAPIQELLTGSGGIIFRIAFEGDPSPVKELISKQPWVKSIESAQANGQPEWRVSVTDENMAKDELLRLVLTQNGLRVTEFGRLKYDLEEVFLKIVEGSENGKR
jgi:ABC-2 type transport system ATP-binding protein